VEGDEPTVPRHTVIVPCKSSRRRSENVQYRELKVPGAWEITPKQIGDARGVFLEWFKNKHSR